MKVHQYILVGILLTGAILFTAFHTQNPETISNIDIIKKLGVGKPYKLKNTTYTKAEWKSMRNTRVEKMNTIIGRQGELLGVGGVYENDNELLTDIQEWFELANAEGCIDNLSGDFVSWDWITETNNKLSNELCSKSIVKIEPIHKDTQIVNDLNIIK